MKDRLPRMTVKIDTTPDEFLRRVETIAMQIGEFVVEAERDPADTDKLTALNLKPILVTHHRVLMGRIVSDPASGKRVHLEVRALRWSPDPPTYRVYVEAARGIFKPLMHQYNQKYRTNRKLQIQSKEATEPHLPVMARQVFEEFIDRASKSALRNPDWQRFYAFTWHCSAHNVHVSRDDVHRLLVNGGFSIEHAADLADIFEHGRNLLMHSRGRKGKEQK
jgi:hypothetical protein